jgi:hypothetical protein
VGDGTGLPGAEPGGLTILRALKGRRLAKAYTLESDIDRFENPHSSRWLHFTPRVLPIGLSASPHEKR